MNIIYVCRQLLSIFHCSIHFFDDSGKIVNILGEIIPEHDPFQMDYDFVRKILKRNITRWPDICCEIENIYYGIIRLPNCNTIVVGPVCVVEPSLELCQLMIRQHHLKIAKEYKLSHCDLKIWAEGLLILHHQITGMELSLNELLQLNEIKDDVVNKVQKSIADVIFTRRENETPHNPYEQEIREMESIQNGDLDMLKKSLQETYQGEVGKLSNNQIRQAKNIAICVITLASRASIRGGVLPEHAFSMVDGYILKIEDMISVAKINAIMRQAEFDFALQVREVKTKKVKNQLIEKTKNYIFQNLHGNIMIKGIGKQFSVNSDYLSTLFHRVEGITIQEYIQKQKIRLSMNMLQYSDYEIKEIAHYLSFSSQSHFGKVFKKFTEVTPLEYRKKCSMAKN